ncbi:hypothetical protein ECEC1865_6263 [Escherichia coli EC1865]|nr:hypothetical protein ECEC1865_6263 [Escherichia coli EC1865]
MPNHGICYHPISRTLGQQHPLIGDALERIMGDAANLLI